MIKQYIFGSVLVFVLLHSTYCLLGVDVVGLQTSSTYTCIKNEGFQFVIVQGFLSYGAVNPYASDSLQNAISAGLSPDISMFPCRGKNATQQVDMMMQEISSKLYGMVWIVVQPNPSPGCAWIGPRIAHCQYLTQLINRINMKGKQVGIFSSSILWNAVFKSKLACPTLSINKLWYAHVDGNASFNDFNTTISFGGWTQPTMKKFDDGVQICNVSLGKNYKVTLSNEQLLNSQEINE